MSIVRIAQRERERREGEKREGWDGPGQRQTTTKRDRETEREVGGREGGRESRVIRIPMYASGPLR